MSWCTKSNLLSLKKTFRNRLLSINGSQFSGQANSNANVSFTELLHRFKPSNQQIAQSKRLFEILGPRSVLHSSSASTNELPNLQIPEIAFVGRTSVGKSSLINALLHHKKLARTSKTPGRTRLINHFRVGSHFYLVDLPGYGYVEGRRDCSSHFVKVAEQYLKKQGGRQLRNVCLLVDAKVGVKKNDLIAVEMLEEFAIPYQVVLTKMDRVTRESHQFLANDVFHTIQSLGTLCFPHLFPVSIKDKSGLHELRCYIATSVGAVK